MKMVNPLEGRLNVSGFENIPAQRVQADQSLISALTVQQYKDPLLAAVRELVTNAAEAHVVAGRADKPFDVSVEVTGKTGDQQIARFAIRDYGPGMSLDFVLDGYYVVGHSTKRDNESIGGSYGLGAKAAFAATSSVEITSWHAGQKHQCLAIMHDGYIRVKHLHSEDSSEPSGVLVAFSIAEKAQEFRDILYRHKETGKLVEHVSTHPVDRSAEYEAYAVMPRFNDQSDYGILYEHRSKKETSLTQAVYRSVIPVGHPGSTYRSAPRVSLYGLPLKLKPWSETTGVRVEVEVSDKELKGYRGSTEALHYRAEISTPTLVAAPRKGTPSFDKEGYINRVKLWSAPDAQPSKQHHAHTVQQHTVVLWHNALYEAPKGLRYRSDFSLYSSPERHPENISNIAKLICVPAGVSLAVTPERSGFRDDKRTLELLEGFQDQGMIALRRQLAQEWQRLFEGYQAEVNQYRKGSRSDLENRRLQSCWLRLQRLVRLLWCSPFSEAHEYLKEGYQKIYETKSDIAFVTWLVDELIEPEQTQYRYTLATTKTTADYKIMVQYQVYWPKDTGPRYTGGNASVWGDWLFVTSTEQLKAAMREMGIASCWACITDDREFFSGLKEAMFEYGIQIVDASDVELPKREPVFRGDFRMVTRIDNNGATRATTVSEARLMGCGDTIPYAISGSKKDWVRGPDGKEYHEKYILADMSQYLQRTFPDLVVIRKSDPKKTEAKLRELGLMPWHEFFAQKFEELYPEWRRYRTGRWLEQCLPDLGEFTNLLTAATGSSDLEKWRKFLGWKKDRWNRQHWVRYERLWTAINEWKGFMPSLGDWAEKDYAASVFPPALRRRALRLHKQDHVVIRAFERRHGHRLLWAKAHNEYRTPLQELGDRLRTSQISSEGDRRVKWTPRELKFVRELARLYVESFSSP